MASAALKQLVGSYLGDGFESRYPTAADAVEAFARCETELAPQLAADVDEALAMNRTTAELAGYLDVLGLSYAPVPDGWESDRAWLLAVTEQVTTARPGS